ncbi:glycosyltransferase family 4 protein [Shewanella sp. SR44-4]|uniref:glycosyltransferase family 4 protein n=1 Tax=Shewanella sp. SR44-4 TaxID=2760935 RepID=UPI0016015AFE|nr:glycosyltransferase family 4 protein [Shewanella sp. SR44-4]MBB1363387.1 glycosyltransferase family 4 protein [Shewanella sp. SR44-4]
MKKICFIITASMNLHSLYRGQFLYLMKQGYEITAIASEGIEHEWLRKDGIKSISVNMKRQPNLFSDFFSVLKLVKVLNTLELDIIVVSTPKASLLGAIATKLSKHRTKVLIYMIRGRAYENFEGIKRLIFKSIDKLICKLSTNVLSISSELRNAYSNEGICELEKITVLGKGSSNGVDLSRFSLLKYAQNDLLQVRSQYGIKQNDFVFLYCGRLRKEKGTDELISAFIEVSESYSNTHLLLVGEYEDFDCVSDENKKLIDESFNITLINWTKNVEAFYAISDVFVFPSYREGFGNVAIEASAMELPVIGYDVVGLRESIEDDFSGILVDKGSVEQLTAAMTLLYDNESLRVQLGTQGRMRVEKYFEDRVVWSRLNDFYSGQIEK